MLHDCLFCHFLTDPTARHRTGEPFRPVAETAHSVAFLSIDPPQATFEHVLVIPRKHYTYLEELPLDELHDLTELLQRAMRVLRTEYEAANVLQNNGAEAGQFVPHVHFHLIPRFPDDGVEIEVWEHKDADPKKLAAASAMLRKKFANESSA